MARPSSQMGLWRGSAPPDRAGNDSVIARAVARGVPLAQRRVTLQRAAEAAEAKHLLFA
jgi:hypothetical protein